MAPLPGHLQNEYDELYSPLVAWFQAQKETQRKIFYVYAKEERFKYYDISNMTPWIKMANILSEDIGAANHGKALEESIDLFFSKVVFAVLKLPSSQMRKFVVFPKMYAAIGYLSRDFYLALTSLVTLFAMTKSQYDYISIIRLCVHLKEWDILEHFLQMDIPLCDDMKPVKEICKLYREFYTCQDMTRQFEIADQAITIRDRLLDGRSYGCYWAMQTAYNLLASTGKLPQADVKRYDCPVSNAYQEKQRCMSPLASRVSKFFKYPIQCVMFDFDEELPEDDNLLKLSIAFSDFCESLSNHCEALIDAGHIKDAAEELLNLGFVSMRAGMVSRVINAFSNLHYVKLRTDYDRDKLKGIGAVLSLLLTPTTGKAAIDRRDDLLNDVYLFRKRNDSDSVIYAIDDCDTRPVIKHESECPCDFCVMKAKNYSLCIEAGFAEAMLHKMHMDEYNVFMSTLNTAYTILDKRRALCLRVLRVKYDTKLTKTRRIYAIGRRYCLATYICMQFNRISRNSNKSLCEGLIKWSNYFLELRFYWLFGRQSLRTPCNLDAYPWLFIPRTLVEDDDSMENSSLFQCFGSFTRRPNKPLRFELSPTRISKTDKRTVFDGESMKKLNLNDDGPVYEGEEDGRSELYDTSLAITSVPSTPSHTPIRCRSPSFCTPMKTAVPASETDEGPPSKKPATPAKSRGPTPPSTPTGRVTRSKANKQQILDFDNQKADTPTASPDGSTPKTSKRTPTRAPKPPPEEVKAPVQYEVGPEVEAEEVNHARGDFKKFSHLFYSDWRPVVCLYIGAFLAETFPWHAAYYFVESLATPLRSIKRRHEKQPEDLRFANTIALKEFIRSLPAPVNIVNLIVDPRNVLWLVRMSADDAPIILPVAKINNREDVIGTKMVEIMKRNDSSVNIRQADEFWKVRDGLDFDLKQLLIAIEKTWLLSFKVLMTPFTHTAADLADNDTYKAIGAALRKVGFTVPRAQFLAELFLNTRKEDFEAMLSVFIYLDRADIDEKYYNVKGQNSLYSALAKNGKKLGLKHPKIVEDKFTIVMLSPELSPYPWEMLPVFNEYPMVMRCQSLHFFKLLIEAAKTVPKAVDASKLYYVINPGNDLEKTENRMRESLYLDSFPGVVRSPPKTAISDILNKYELLCYVGHGSGNNIFGTKLIRNSVCNAATILMGCSSARIEQEGRLYDGKGAVHDYVVAGSPFVMGCLWMVTDGEIDKYFVALMRYCCQEFVNENSTFARKLSGRLTFDTLRILITAMVRARGVCRLPYLTGGSVVAYGIPCINVKRSREVLAEVNDSFA
uniref:separase n=1 Tax=Panagrellus redivivus TaxID=6233 RepID=A0A7E4VWU9_PANRE